MFGWKAIWDALNRRCVLITIMCQFKGTTGNCSISESIVLIAALLKGSQSHSVLKALAQPFFEVYSKDPGGREQSRSPRGSFLPDIPGDSGTQT